MLRLKFLFLALGILLVAGVYLSQRAQSADAFIRQSASDRLKGGPAVIAAFLQQDAQILLAMARAVAPAAAPAMDDQGRPTPEALEAVRSAVERSQSAEAERPVLVVIAGQGTVGRYRAGQSNRIDKDLSAFPALADAPPLPRAGVGVLDGEVARFAAVQFDETKLEGVKAQLALGFPLDDALAQRLSQRTGGADVTFVQKGKVVGSSLPSQERAALKQLEDLKGSITFGALSGDAFALTGAVPPLDAMLRLPMFAQGHRNFGVLTAPGGFPPDVKVLLSVRTTDEYAQLAGDQRALLLWLLLLVVVALVFAATSTDPAKGLARVVIAAEKLVQGDREVRAPTQSMTALVRRAAVAVNSLASQAEAAQLAPVSAPSAGDGLRLRPNPPPALPDLGPERAPEPLSKFELPSQPAEAEGEVDSFLQGGAGRGADLFDRDPRPSNGALSAAVMQNASDDATGSSPFLPPPEPPREEFAADETVVAETPEALIRATQRASSFSPGAAAPAGGGAVPLPPPPNTEESHFQSIYREFVATRERCGEPADGLTYDKFAGKLRKNQEQLIAKYACRTVRFQVYVKEGKAALKATPVK